jgi:hypothetical protein
MTRDLESTLTIELFESGNIDPEQFDHEAHVYIGWLYVRKFELAVAISRFDAGLKRLTAFLGVPEKYHATITWLFLLLIAERFDSDENWQGFRSRNEELISNSKTTLNRYYSDALLFSERARERFVLPDKMCA